MNRLGAAVMVLVLALASRVWACPMCALNGDRESNLPQALTYSILFMLAVPPTVLGGIGFVIWRAHRRHRLAQEAFASSSDPVGSVEPEACC